MSYDDFPAKFALKATLCMNIKSDLIYLRQNSSYLLPFRNASFRAKFFFFSQTLEDVNTSLNSFF